MRLVTIAVASLVSLTLLSPGAAAAEVEGILVSPDETAVGQLLRVEMPAFTAVTIDFEVEWLGDGHGEPTIYLWSCPLLGPCAGSPSQTWVDTDNIELATTANFDRVWVMGTTQDAGTYPLPSTTDPRPFPASWRAEVNGGYASAVLGAIDHGDLVAV